MMQEQSHSYTGFGESASNRTGFDNARSSAAGHKLVMDGRERVELTGVTEVISFDNEQVHLETTLGALRFGGEGLHVKRLMLERGEVSIEGHIDEIVYFESSKTKSAGGLLRRLFS